MTITDEIKKAVGVLFQTEQVVEIRAFTQGRPRWSGYFDDLDILITKVDALSTDTSIEGIYLTLNPCNPELLARQCNSLGPVQKTTADADIVRRTWMLIDVDPVRRSGISATENEHATAFLTANAIRDYLKGLGWPAPVLADSGNGAHLLYRVDLPNDKVATSLIHRCLRSLNARFSEEGVVKVDRSVSNAARLVRAYGTVNRKGSDMPDRPHRRSRLITIPEAMETVPVELMQALAIELDDEQALSAEGDPPPSTMVGGFDLRTWLAVHAETLAAKGIVVREKQKDGYRYFGEFEQCPWSSDHVAGAFIGQLDSGAIFARCHHDTCGGTEGQNRWSEFRDLIEPKKKAKTKKGEHDDPPRKILPYFELNGRLYLDVTDDAGRHWFAHLDDANDLVFDAKVTGNDGIEIYPRELDRHPDSGLVVPIVRLPNREAMADAVVPESEELYRSLDDHLNRYVDAPPLDRQLFIYYILYTWLYQKCPTAPYLRFLADTGKGKSRFLRVVADLCFYPIAAGGSSTASGIMRYKEKWHGTLRIDEADLQGGADNPVIKYLNEGFEKDQPYILTNKNDPKKQEFFDPFGPKVIAMREPFGDVATESRVISFSPRETYRTDIPVELNARYVENVKALRARIARFILQHWQEVDGELLLDLSGVEVEMRLKQMIRPLSLVLQLFPDGQGLILAYLKERQIELKRERAASFDGLCFNMALGIATGAAELQDDPKFAKYFPYGSIQAVEPCMIAELLGRNTTTVSKALRRIGFTTTSTKILFRDPVADGKDESGWPRQKIITRKKTIIKVSVPDEARWREMVRRYHFVDPGNREEGQAMIVADETPECPEILKGHHYTTIKACASVSGTGGTGGPVGDTDRTGATAGTAPQGARPIPIVDDEYRHVQSNPHPCGKCGRSPSHYAAGEPGHPIDMTDPANRYMCKGCHDAATTAEGPGVEVAD